MFSTKQVILDPLTELTESAHRIEMGDFTAAHQTLRSDEIGVLINSFAKMVQAVQIRERELATGARRIARAGQRHRGIAPPRRGRARRPAGHARNRARGADDLQCRRQRPPAQSRRHRGVRHRAAEPRAAQELLEPIQAHRQGRHADPAGAMDLGARAARRDDQERRARDSSSRRPRLSDSRQRRAAQERARSRRRRGGRLPGHRPPARSRSHEGRVRVDRQPRAAHAADLDSRLGAARARRGELGCRSRSIASCCRSR